MSNTTLAQPGTQAAGAPVSWQTIFWTLVPLAISSMSQPGGRICGLPARYRTYLRCSPILCCVDGLSIVLQLGILCVYQKQRLLESVGVIIHERFSTEDHAQCPQPNAQLPGQDEDDEAEGVQSIEKMTWLRWLWFILGTLSPAIKLFSMTGVRWEQAWGLMFLSSWILNESLIIFAAMNQSFFTFSPSGQISWPGFEQTTLSSRNQRFRLAAAKYQRWLALAAICCHSVVLNGVFRVTFRKWRTGVPPTRQFAASQSPSGGAVSPGSVITMSLGMIPGIALVLFYLRISKSFLIEIVLLLLLTWLLLVNIGFNSSYYQLSATVIESPGDVSVSPALSALALNSSNYLLMAKSSFSAQYVFVVSTVFALVFLYFVEFLGRKFLMLGKNILIAYPDAQGGAPKIDCGVILSLIFFLTTILACLLWYGCVYDPSGTSNPSWTGVFG